MTRPLASEGELLRRQRHHTHMYKTLHQTLSALADFQHLTNSPAVQGRAARYQRLDRESGQMTGIERVLIQSDEVNVLARNSRFANDFDYFHPVTGERLRTVEDIKILATEGPLKFHLRGHHLSGLNFYPQLTFTASDQRTWRSRTPLFTICFLVLGLCIHLIALLFQLGDHPNLSMSVMATIFATSSLFFEGGRFHLTMRQAATEQLVNTVMNEAIYQPTRPLRLPAGYALTFTSILILITTWFLPASTATLITLPVIFILMLTWNDVLHRRAEIEGQRLATRVVTPLATAPVSAPLSPPPSVQGEDRIKAEEILTQLRELSENSMIDPYLRWRSFTAFHTDWPESLRLIEQLPSHQQTPELLHHLDLLVRISQGNNSTSGRELQAHRHYLEALAQEPHHA